MLSEAMSILEKNRKKENPEFILCRKYFYKDENNSYKIEQQLLVGSESRYF